MYKPPIDILIEQNCSALPVCLIELHGFVLHIDSIVSDEVDITLAQARECWELAQQDVRKENNNG